MIYPAKYNGINFSYDFTRESLTTDFDSQRRMSIINGDVNNSYLSFFIDADQDSGNPSMTFFSDGSPITITPDVTTTLSNGFLFFFKVPKDTFSPGIYTAVFSVGSGDGISIVYSEIIDIKADADILSSEICNIIALNNDATHGYLTASETAFGYFKYSKLDSDFFVKELTEYKYSYSRKKVLKSENQIAKRFEFFDLTMYQRNLLKWLCNCENFTIDGIAYQLISDFTEVNKQKGSEICDMTADFVETNQSFFSAGSTTPPTNIFATNFFN
jgi:hypothetical protein